MSQEEITTLNRIVSLYLDFAELQAEEHRPMYMKDWIAILDDFLRISRKDILTHAGRISAQLAKAKADSDWATEMRNRGECVVSGFSSKLEQDVLHFLLKGSQPIIIVLARRMYRDIPDELKEPLAQNRLLIISVSNAVRQSKVTAMARNRYVCEMADKIFFVGVTEQSSLYAFKKEFENNNN